MASADSPLALTRGVSPGKVRKLSRRAVRLYPPRFFDSLWASYSLAYLPPVAGLSVCSCSYGRRFAFGFFQLPLTGSTLPFGYGCRCRLRQTPFILIARAHAGHTRERFETVPYIQPSTSRHPLFHCLKKCNGNFELTGHDYSGIKKPDFEKKESIMVLSLSSPLILASASPRRKELLSAVGLTFKVRPADVDETGLPDENPRAHVRRLSAEKAAVIARRYPKALVLGADTIVVIDGQILGKPRDQKQARAMMRQLSNRKHTVFTGFTIACKQTGAAKTGVVQSAVYFKEISPDEMDWYVNSREPYDKAGGYAAQGMGASFIQAIRGSYTNVIGLPLCEVMEALKSMDAIHFREPA